MNYRVCSLFVVVATLVSPQIGLGAANSKLEEEVNKLLEIGWEPSYASRKAADNQFKVIAQIAPNNPQANYAYALVLMKQRRYSPAAKLLATQVESHPANAYVLKAKAWLSLLMKQHTTSLVEFDRFSQVSSKDAANAQFLGTAFGFFEGPAADQVPDATLREYRERVLASFPEEQQAVFETARGDVVEQFATFFSEKSDIEEKAQEQAEEERQRLIDDLEKQDERMAERRKDLEPVREKLLEELKSELAEIENDLRPLALEIARLESQATVPRNEILFLSGEIARLRARAERETENPLVRDSLLREADRLSFLAVRYDADLRLLERRAAAINAQRAELVRRGQVTQANYQGQLNQINAEVGSINAQQRRNSLDQTKVLRPAQGDRRQSRALAAQANALTTYLEFPLDAEKQRLLEQLKADSR